MENNELKAGTKPAEIAPLDLASLDTSAASNAGAELELRHPTTRKPIGIFVGLLGKHGEVFRELVRERQNGAIKKRAAAERMGVEPDLPTAEEIEAEALDLLVACSTGWRTVTKDAKGEIVSDTPTLTFEGKALPFSVPNARLVYSRILWIRQQVDEGVGNLELFIPA